jgi:hypothetical protein
VDVVPYILSTGGTGSIDPPIGPVVLPPFGKQHASFTEEVENATKHF